MDAPPRTPPDSSRTRRTTSASSPSRPRPDATEAVIDVVYGGICGSDLHYWHHGAAGLSILKAPMLLGHEIVGVVREGASDGSGPTPGTPVAVHPARPGPGDGTQRYPADRPNLAPAAPTSAAPRTDRTPRAAFAHYVTLARTCCAPSARRADAAHGGRDRARERRVARRRPRGRRHAAAARS